MISNVSTFAPAGVLRSGSVVARPYACADVRPALLGAVAGVEGLAVPATGLPWAGKPAVVMGERFRATAPTGVDAQPISTQHDPITQNDGTTLGIHPRGRSTS